MTKITVEIIHNGEYGDYTKGMIGYVTGYVRGGDNRAYACILLKEERRIAMVHLNHLIVKYHGF